MPDATVIVTDVTTKEGTGKTGKPWKLYNLVDGNGDRYTTFDAALGSKLEGLKGKRANIVFDIKEQGNDLKSAVEAKEEKQAGGSRWDDPETQRRITLLATLKCAVPLVVAGAESDVSTNELTERTKVVASKLAMWVEQWAQTSDDDIPFG